jgi:hypothetical protein
MAIDWGTVAELATAGGTLALAISTFASVRSANRSARASEEALLVGLQPLLVPSRLQDERQKIFFMDGKHLVVDGGGAAVDVDGDVAYLAMSVRNAGQGIAVLRCWHAVPGRQLGEQPPDLSVFRRHSRDIYVPPSDLGFWQAAFRDGQDPERDEVIRAIKAAQPLTVDVYYGDYEGGQGMVSRFIIQPVGDDHVRWLPTVGHHWNIDRPDPRWRPGDGDVA